MGLFARAVQPGTLHSDFVKPLTPSPLVKQHVSQPATIALQHNFAKNTRIQAKHTERAFQRNFRKRL